MSFGPLRIRWTTLLCALILLHVSSVDSAVVTRFTRGTLELLQEEGHTIDDILTAETLSDLYDIDFGDLLEERQNGVSWSTIIYGLDHQDASYIQLGSDGIEGALRKGFGVNDVITGDLMANRFHYPPEVMLILNKETAWLDLFETLYEQEEQWDRRNDRLVGVQHDVVDMPSVVRSRLSDSKIELHLARGLNEHDLLRAIELSDEYSADVDLVMAVKSKSFQWVDAIKLLRRLMK